MNGEVVIDRQLSNQCEYYSADKFDYDPGQKSSSVRARALGNRPPGHDRPFFTSRYENELNRQGLRIERRNDSSPTHQNARNGELLRLSSNSEEKYRNVPHKKNSSQRTRSAVDSHDLKLKQNDPSTSRQRSRNRSKHASDRQTNKDRGQRKRSNNRDRSEERNQRCAVYQNGNIDKYNSTEDRNSSYKGSDRDNSHASRKSLNSKNGSRKSRDDSKGYRSQYEECCETRTENHYNKYNRQVSDIHGSYNEMASLDNRISVDSYSGKTRRASDGCRSIESEINNSPHTVEQGGKTGGHTSKNPITKRTTSKHSNTCCGTNSKQKRRCMVCLLIVGILLTLGLVAAGLFVYMSMTGAESGTHLYDMVKAHVRLRIINKDYSTSLGDADSGEFSSLAAKFCREIDIIYLTSTVYMDYYGCTLQTASAGSIQIYYVTPFLDSQYTSNVSVHKEILTSSRPHLSGSVKSTLTSGPEKDVLTSGVHKDTVTYGDFLIDANSIDIFLEKYTTDRLPPRPKFPNIATSDIEPNGESLGITHKQLDKSSQSSRNPQTTTTVSSMISGVITQGTNEEAALNNDVKVKNGTTVVDINNNTMPMQVATPSMHTDGNIAGVDKTPDGVTTFKPVANYVTRATFSTTTTPVKQAQTIVQVLGDEVSLGEAASIRCRVFTKEEIEALSFKRTNQNGLMSVGASFTGDQLKTILSGEVQTQDKEKITIYKIESIVVIQLNFSTVNCKDAGDFECKVKLATGSETSSHGRLIGKEPPGQPSMTLPGPLVENRELIRPITCTGNVGFPPGRIQWLIKPRGTTEFIPFEGNFVSKSGTCNNYVTNSLIYTPTRDGNGTLLKCVVVNEHVPLETDLAAVTELQILPENLCDDVPDGQSIRHPFTCTKYIRCHGKDYDVHDCDNQMCFDEKSGKCGQISLVMPTVNAILNDGVALIKCRLVHNGAWNTISISKLPTSGEKIEILTAARGVRAVTVHQSTMSGRIHIFVDESKMYQVEVNLWVELTCADEGSYVCEVDAPFHVPGAVGNITIQAQPGAPKLTIPNQIVENLLMLQNVSCEADVGYPHGNLVLKVKRPTDSDFFAVHHQTTTEETRNCSQIVTTSFAYVPRLEHNGMLIRCELENNATLPFNHKYVAEEKIHVLPANFCQIAGDQTIQEHPYDCHQYVSCLDGHIYVQRCGSSHCFDPLTLRCDREDRTETEFDPHRPCQPDKNGIFFRHPVLCNKFFWCVQGREVVRHCPLGTLYLDGGQYKCVFLKELQSCEDCPTKLGRCFVNRKDEFQMYSLYCQNKPRSEELRMEVGDNNPFFKECQRKLGHKLPLGAFLLKPVQRITKYQLLLKEMLKYTKDDKTCQQQLDEALNTMLEVLRIVNNSMYQVSIVSYTGNLSDLGKLLMQGSFNVMTEHRNEKIRDIRFKPMHRHLFLYEKAILMCKRKEDTHNRDKDIFSYKNMLRCNQVGLTENIKGDKKKFELWLRGREEVYIVQAPSLEVKDFWVKEIKKVLMGQFDEIKVNKLNLIQRSSEDLTRSGSDSGMESWRHRQGSGNNNTSTVPVGLTMMSPESPPDPRLDNDRWSENEFTDSEPETERQKDTHISPLEPSYLQQFVAIAHYRAVDDVEMGLQEGDIVEILRTGSTGWWLAHHLTTNEEGWVPSTYLDPVPNTGSRSMASVSSIGSGSQADQTSRSSVTSGYSATSPVDETTI